MSLSEQSWVRAELKLKKRFCFSRKLRALPFIPAGGYSPGQWQQTFPVLLLRVTDE